MQIMSMNEECIFTAVHKEIYVEAAFATDTQSSYYQKYMRDFLNSGLDYYTFTMF